MAQNNSETGKYLIVKTKSEEARKKLESDPKNPQLWYELGMALSNEEGAEAGIDAFSQGLSYNPFNASLYFGRGRRNIGLWRLWRCIADTTIAIRLQPEQWSHWYYRAVAYNLNGDYALAIEDFKQCYRMTPPEHHYPLVDWLFLCYLDMGDTQKAEEVLDMVDVGVIPEPMDYVYRRRVMLYKGLVTPDDFIDIDDIMKGAQPDPGGLDLEIHTLTFGLYAYYTYHGETAKANEVLKEITAFPKTAAFGYLKGMKLARERGLVD